MFAGRGPFHRRTWFVATTAVVWVVAAAPATMAQPEFTTPTFAGHYADPAGIAPLYPAGGDADAEGNRYIADSGGDRVVRIDPAGEMTVVLDRGLDKPRSLALDPDGGSAWVLDTRDNQIVQVSIGGQVLKVFGGGGLIKAAFGITADTTGVYVADTYRNRVIKVAKTDGRPTVDADHVRREDAVTSARRHRGLRWQRVRGRHRPRARRGARPRHGWVHPHLRIAGQGPGAVRGTPRPRQRRVRGVLGRRGTQRPDPARHRFG
jgi:hypothetical protein